LASPTIFSAASAGTTTFRPTRTYTTLRDGTSGSSAGLTATRRVDTPRAWI